MKWPFLLSASSPYAPHAITPDYQAVMIGCGLVIYLTAIIAWTIIAKKSLDRILEDVNCQTAKML